MFVQNAPANAVDPHGLYEFIDCEQWQIDQMERAIKDSCDRAKKCAGACPNPEGPIWGVHLLCDKQGIFWQYKFHCRKGDWVDPRTKQKCGSYCALSDPGVQDIDICAQAFDENEGCGGIGCTMFHEILHAGGRLEGRVSLGHTEDHAKFDSCMGCPFNEEIHKN
jgi:hypothetical protein